MDTLIKEIEKVNGKLQSVVDLLQVGEIVRLGKNELRFNDANVETLIDLPHIQAGFARYEKIGDSTPHHKHPENIEYLIQCKGRCACTFENGGYRILEVGEIAKLDRGELHQCVALAEHSEQMWVCIPAEEGYKMENLPDTLRNGLKRSPQ